MRNFSWVFPASVYLPTQEVFQHHKNAIRRRRDHKKVKVCPIYIFLVSIWILWTYLLRRSTGSMKRTCYGREWSVRPSGSPVVAHACVNLFLEPQLHVADGDATVNNKCRRVKPRTYTDRNHTYRWRCSITGVVHVVQASATVDFVAPNTQFNNHLKKD